MILTCPDCATRYMLDPALLAPAGRRVRCTVCATVWFEKPDGEQAVESSALPPPVEDIPQSVRPLPDPLALRPAQISTRRPLMAGLAAGAMAGAGVVAAVLWLLAAQKDRIVHLWPPVAMLFESAGLKISIPGEGLVFDQVKATLAGTPEAGATLTVAGKIINMTGSEKHLPPVTASVSGAEDLVPRETWFVPLPISRLEPERAFAFTVTRALQEGDGDQLTLRFSETEDPDSALKLEEADPLHKEKGHEAPEGASPSHGGH